MTRPVTLVLAIVLAPVSVLAQDGACARGERSAAVAARAGWSRWGGDVRNTRFVDGGATGLRAATIPRLRLAWAYSLGAVVNARSQPAVANGVVFVGSEAGRVVALDMRTGCTRWSVAADMPVRSALVVSTDSDGTASVVYFGDVGGNVYGLDARTGARRWKTHVDPHPTAVITGAPQLYDGVLYVPVSSYESVLPAEPGYACCTFRGSVVALDAATGATRWKTWTIPDSARGTGRTPSGANTLGPSGAAVWSTPTVDERLDRLYVGTGNNYSEPTSGGSDAVVALDRRTGRIVWTRQYTAHDAYNLSCDIPGHANCPAPEVPDADFGQPPILLTLGGGRRALVIGQKSGQVHALDPDRDGAPLWTTRIGAGGRLGGPHWGSAADERTVFVAQGGQAIVPIRVDTPTVSYRLEPDPTKGGGLMALDPATGTTRWSARAPICGSRPRCSPAQSAPVTAVPGAVLSGALDGHLRAYAAADGRVLWDYDTARELPTRNGPAAHGGSLDVAGPVVAGGMVFVMSGYGLNSAMPGNLLLAFTIGPR